MCGRYLIEEEAYSDILEILYSSGMFPSSGGQQARTLPVADEVRAQSKQRGGCGGGMVSGGGSAVLGGGIPGAIKDAMTATMAGDVSETVPASYKDLFQGETVIVTNGEVFPTNVAPVYAQGGPKLIKWGFPHWKNNSVIINARAETALEKTMFRKALMENRCVVPSNGFFEWGSSAFSGGSGELDNLQIGMFGSGYHENCDYSRKRRGKKTKYLLRHGFDTKLYMAGFWCTFKEISTDSPDATEYKAFVILTTKASPGIYALHDRMPVILSADERDDWLGDMGFAQFVLQRPGPELEIDVA